MITVEGEATTAYVMGMENGELEDSAREQIQEIVDHPGFENPIRVMPDVHVGAAAMVGFTMQLGNRIIPNVVGVDIGCGMYAIKITDFDDAVTTDDGFDHETIEERVRSRVPIGWGEEGMHAPNRGYYHVKDDFPWDAVNERLDNFIDAMDEAYVGPMREFRDNGGYDIEYFNELCNDRAGEMSKYFDEGVGINSVGTLGSGNHFIELAQGDESGDYWVVVHSGSRGLGGKTAGYHQERAIKLRDGRADDARDALRELIETYDADYVKFDVEAVSDEDLLDWLHGGMGEGFINFDALKRDFTGEDRERINEIRNEFNTVIPATDTPDIDESMDWLEGEEASQYLIDMIFAQEYAKQNRIMMAEAVADELGATIEDDIHAIHNFIDFRDQIIRKGATRAYDGERVVVPMNMQDGTFIVEGKSNPDWNKSVSHGAGRTMSRREADETVDSEAFRDGMDAAGVYAGVYPEQEAPDAYKDPEFIEDAIQDTATVVEHLSVVHNFKADD